MKKVISLALIVLINLAVVTACGGGGGGGSIAPPPPPPSPAAQTVPGLWDGLSVTGAAPDVFTSFEFNDSGPFSIGTTPYTASFSNGNAETRGVPQFYITGVNAWHILVGTSATVTFETLPNTLSFHARMPAAGDVGQIQVIDENSTVLQTIVPTEVFQQVDITRTSGQSLIGSVVVTSTSGGDVVIDDLTFGYSGFGFTGGTDDIGCLVSENREFVCLVADSITEAPISTAHGMLEVANDNEVSGTGTLYAAPGAVLANEKTVADLTVSSGTISTGTSIDLLVEAAGATSVVAMDFDPDYNRGSDLATVAAVYSSVEINGDSSSLSIDAGGVMLGQTAAGCNLNGQVSIIDAMFNAYDVQLIVTGCAGLDGTYDGLGVSQDEVAMDDSFVFVVSTDQVGLLGLALK